MLRENDIFCRIGGEEFVLLLPHVGLEDAKVTAEKIRTFVESWKKVVPITMSFGVVEYIQGESEDGLFKRADEALYSAKEQGRNRVVIG
jgi:diguanylate cyclase (GGDEF)-like protein